MTSKSPGVEWWQEHSYSRGTPQCRTQTKIHYQKKKEAKRQAQAQTGALRIMDFYRCPCGNGYCLTTRRIK